MTISHHVKAVKTFILCYLIIAKLEYTNLSTSSCLPSEFLQNNATNMGFSQVRTFLRYFQTAVVADRGISLRVAKKKTFSCSQKFDR